MRRDYCTYFDHRYLTKGLALYRSLERNAGEFRLYVLCLTPETLAALEALGLERARLVTPEELEAFDPELAATKPTRSTVEYYFTCTPAWMRFLLARESDVELLTYLDADLFFFSSPEPLFEELDGASIGIVPHRFSPQLREREIYGRYNVGWVTFARDETARACLERWREQCLEWCYDRVESGRFADQKYLDDWPERFPRVVILNHPGANLAPWNLENHALHHAGSELLVDGRLLIFLHSQGAKFVLGEPFRSGLEEYAVRPTELIAERIYAPYLRALEAALGELRAIGAERLDRCGVRPTPGSSVGPSRVAAVPETVTAAGWPRITVVTPVLNQAGFLEAALESVLDQEYPNLEFIVIDGGSTDGSREIVQRFSGRLSSWVSEPDRGQAHALNKGFERSTGELMGWLNADDLLLPGSLFLVGGLFASFPEVEWLTSRSTSLDPLGRIVDSVPSLPWTRSRFLAGGDEYIQQESTFWRRALWERAGGALSEAHFACDFELWARFFRHAALHQTRGAIGAFRLRPDQSSRGQKERYQREVREIVARERAAPESAAVRDELEETLHELAFDLASWRFDRVQAVRPEGGGARELEIRTTRLEAALELSERDRAARLDVIRRLEVSIGAYEAALAGRIEENRVLERALAGRIKQIEDLHRSLSWRFTAPLRWLADRLAGRP